MQLISVELQAHAVLFCRGSNCFAFDCISAEFVSVCSFWIYSFFVFALICLKYFGISQKQQQQHETWHCDIRLKKERERKKNSFFLFCCFKCNSHRHPLQLLESDGNYYGSMFEYTGTNADRTVAHCAFALHIQYQFYWFFSHFLYTSATTMPKWMK